MDEATEPGISDEDGERKRIALVEMVLSGGDPRMGSPSGSSAGAAVAFAIRKRLKSDDHVAVLNTLTLLDETMRTCPYFYRYVANDKFFRRMWRFVDPEYKSDLRGKIPFVNGSKAGKMAAATRSSAVNIELGERVLILIRAWAEELSIMHSGQQDPDAGFFIERYSNKRMRIKFPDVPATGTPWVCHVGHSGRSSFSSHGTGIGKRTTTKTTNPLPKNLGLGEVENTVNLLENMIEKAADVSEVRSDVCSDLVERCRLISQHIDTMSATMEKDEDIARAIKVSERLHSTVGKYDQVMETGVLNSSAPPIVDGLSSADESYGPADREYSAGGSGYFEEEHDALGAALGAGASRRREREQSVGSSSSAPYSRREDESERQRQLEKEAAEGEREREREREERAREKAQAKKEKEAERKRAEKKEARKTTDSGSKASGKSEKSGSKASSKVAPSSSGKSCKSSKSSSRSAPAFKESLVDVAGRSDTKSSSSDESEEKKENVFSSLAERHSTSKSARSPPPSTSSVPVAPSAAGFIPSSGQGMSTIAEGVNDMSIRGVQQQQSPPAGSPPQQQQQMPVPYGSMMMMPNPMAMSMYGSYTPAMQSQPQPQSFGGLPTAYNTINPAMYYSNFNPMAYGSVNPMMQPPQQIGQQGSLPQSTAVPSGPGSVVSQYGSVHPSQHSPSVTSVQPVPQQQTQAPPAPGPSSAGQTAQAPTAPVQSLTTTSLQLTPVAPPPPAPAPPPPPQPSSYVTVTNAPAPPPGGPPPPEVSPSAALQAPQMSPGQAPDNSSVVQAPPKNSPSVPQQPSRSFERPGHPQQASKPAQQLPNPGLYASGTSQPYLGNQSFLYQSVPHQTGQPEGQYNSVYGAPMQGPPNPDQAAMYQSAMANAAAAYHAAASAYQSVQGQAPFVPQAAQSSASQQSSDVPQ